MEILIVIALIAGIVSLVVANLDVLLGSNKEKIAEVFVNESVKTPLMAYKINIGNYPSTEEGIDALATPPPEKAARWRGPYIEKIPVDHHSTMFAILPLFASHASPLSRSRIPFQRIKVPILSYVPLMTKSLDGDQWRHAAIVQSVPFHLSRVTSSAGSQHSRRAARLCQILKHLTLPNMN